MRHTLLILCFVAGINLGCSSTIAPLHLAEQPKASEPADKPFDWQKEIGSQFNLSTSRTAVLNEKKQVYSITVMRSDAEAFIEGMPIPAEAGLYSTFHFYKCNCGKLSVMGEFILLDYEVNDVIDSLRNGNLIQIAGI